MRGMSAHQSSNSSSRNKDGFKLPSTSSSFLTSYDGGLRSGILSPALSTATSTSVTPITPMTPMTTPTLIPRTPAQALLGCQPTNLPDGHVKSGDISTGHHEGGYQDGSHAHTSAQHNTYSLNEDDRQSRAKQLLALELFSNFLNSAESTLSEISEREHRGHHVIGQGIVRMCHDLADGIDEVAKELQKERDFHQQQHLSLLAGHDLQLTESVENEGRKASVATNETALALSAISTNDFSDCTNLYTLSSDISHEEIVTSISTAHTVLTDVATALRAITQDEAQELGEVALEVAEMFIWSLRVVHRNMIQMAESNEYQNPGSSKSSGETSGMKQQHRVTWSTGNGNGRNGLGPLVEILGEEEKKDEHYNLNNGPTVGTPPKKSSGFTPQLSPIHSPPSQKSQFSGNTHAFGASNSNHRDRLRVLWPPILPAVAEASKHCASSAMQHPLPAIALGVTCGPAAMATAFFVAPPVLIADWAIQSSYNALSDTPVIENVEKGAANAFQVARLAVLCSKLVIKQGIAVGESQIERRGGVGRICADVVNGAVDMALHPVETVGMAWEGLFWMGGAIKDTVGFVQGVANRGDFRMDMH